MAPGGRPQTQFDLDVQDDLRGHPLRRLRFWLAYWRAVREGRRS